MVIGRGHFFEAKRTGMFNVTLLGGLIFIFQFLLLRDYRILDKNRRLTPKIVWEYYYLVRLPAIDTVHCFMNHLIITTIESILPHPVIDRRGPEVHN